MLCAKFLRNWPSGSGGEFFFNLINVFLLSQNYFPLGKGVTLHLNKLEFPLPKNALCQVWLKLAQWFWRRRRNWKDGRQLGDQKRSLELSAQMK